MNKVIYVLFAAMASGQILAPIAANVSGGAPPAPIALVSKAFSIESAATSSIDTTGATLLVAVIASLGAQGGVTDSKSNTWTCAAAYSDDPTYLRTCYVCNPTVGTGHTFTGSGTFTTLFASAWSGTATTSCVDGTPTGTFSTGGGGGSTFQPGSQTPANNGSLIIVGYANTADSQTASIDSGFTIADQYTGATTSMRGALGYLVQTTAAAVNPAWTISTTSVIVRNMIVFKPSGGV